MAEIESFCRVLGGLAARRDTDLLAVAVDTIGRKLVELSAQFPGAELAPARAAIAAAAADLARMSNSVSGADLAATVALRAGRRFRPWRGARAAARVAASQGAEIDLLLQRGDRLFGVECKRADAPRATPSVRIAMEDLGLERVADVYPGNKRFALNEGVEAVPLASLAVPGRLFAA